MKELLKVYAPIVLFVVGGLLTWGVYGSYLRVAKLEEQNALLREQTEGLIEEKNALILGLSNQCTSLLVQQGYQVVPPAVPPEGEPNGEDTR